MKICAFKTVIISSILFKSFLVCQFTNDCGTFYGCFLHPANCQNSQCDMIVKWRDQNSYVEFHLITSLSGSDHNFDLYNAIAFSYDKQMGDDSVCMCRVKSYVVESYYNDWREKNTDVASHMDRGLGISYSSISVNQSLVICKFSRLKTVSNQHFRQTIFNLTRPYYLLVAWGSANSLVSPLYHGVNAYRSPEPIDFRSSVVLSPYQIIPNKHKRKAHGCLMIIAWVLFASTGILVARHFKHLYENISFCGIKFWYLVHRPLMAFVFLLSIIAFLVILSDLNWAWTSAPKGTAYAHSILGILTIVAMFFQIFIAVLRPARIHPKRKVFNLFHQFSGVFTYVFAIINMFLGLAIDKMYLGRFGWGLMLGWVIWYTIILLTLEILNQITGIHFQSRTYYVQEEKSIGRIAERPSDKKKQQKWVHLLKALLYSSWDISKRILVIVLPGRSSSSTLVLPSMKYLTYLLAVAFDRASSLSY